MLEHCAESELHPRSGLGMLKGRQSDSFKTGGPIRSLGGFSIFSDELTRVNKSQRRLSDGSSLAHAPGPKAVGAVYDY